MEKGRKDISGSQRRNQPTIGWREWIRMPEFGVFTIKAKIDSGARSSALHAVQIEEFRKDDERWIRFRICPQQKNSTVGYQAEARLLEYRTVRSSSGKAAKRPVIITTIELMGETWPIELTLTSRDQMGFRMLLGREAFRNRFLVDAGKSYLGGTVPK